MYILRVSHGTCLENGLDGGPSQSRQASWETVTIDYTGGQGHDTQTRVMAIEIEGITWI